MRRIVLATMMFFSLAPPAYVSSAYLDHRSANAARDSGVQPSPSTTTSAEPRTPPQADSTPSGPDLETIMALGDVSEKLISKAGAENYTKPNRSNEVSRLIARYSAWLRQPQNQTEQTFVTLARLEIEQFRTVKKLYEAPTPSLNLLLIDQMQKVGGQLDRVVQEMDRSLKELKSPVNSVVRTSRAHPPRRLRR